MDLNIPADVPRSPRIEITSNLSKSPKELSRASSQELILLRHSPKKSSDSSNSSLNNSSEEESPKIFKHSNIISSNLTFQLENLIATVAIEKEEREKKNIELDSTLASLATNHQNILNCLKKFQKDKKTILGNNQQQIQESALIKQDLDDIKKSYETLQTQFQKVEKILQQQLTLNTDACEQTKKNYTQITERIKKLEQTYDQLVKMQTIIPLLNQIMSTAKLKNATAQMKENKIAQTNAETLEDVLMQQQEELLKVLKNTIYCQTHIHNLNTKIATLTTDTHTLARRVRLFMTGSIVFFTSFLIWWHTHKA
jgi:hypothetical protein